MPIEVDDNYTLQHYRIGMEWAWKDTARHRNDATGHIGEHTKAQEYAPMYLSDATKCLPMLRQNLLPAPTEMGLAEVDDIPVLRTTCKQFVLPRPLVDVVLSTSRLNCLRHDWYPSPLRAKWAEHAMSRACSLIASERYNDAAIYIASVFGTLLCGHLVDGLTPEESNLFRRATGALGHLVDMSLFLEQLYLACGVPYASSLKGINRTKAIEIRERYGPKELQLAERAAALAIKIEQLEKRIEEEGLPQGRDTIDFEILSIANRPVVYLHLVGDIMTFEPESERGRPRFSVWVIDREDGRLKLARLRPEWYTRLVALDSECKDIIIEAGEGIDTRRVNIQPDRRAPKLTKDEITASKGAIKERVIGLYSGRVQILEELRQLRDEQESVLSNYEGAMRCGQLEEEACR